MTELVISIRAPDIDANESYCREHAPFNFLTNCPSTIVLDHEFARSINGSWFEQQLYKLFATVIIMPDGEHVRLDPKISHHEYITICNLFLDWYSADHWSNVLENAQYVDISAGESVECLRGQYPPELMSRLTSAINTVSEPDIGAFVKFRCKSTKHEYPPVPVHSGKEALDHLLQSTQLRRLLEADLWEGNSVGILVRRWEEDITAFNEFRAFVVGGRVIAISQQYLGHNPVAGHIVTAYGEALIQAVQRLWDIVSARLQVDMRYKDATLDIWFTFEEGNEGADTADMSVCVEAHLIEINTGSGSGWTAAGSALFTWDELRELVENGKREIRYY